MAVGGPMLGEQGANGNWIGQPKGGYKKWKGGAKGEAKDMKSICD